MSSRFREITKLAEERGRSVEEMADLLRDRGIAVINGLYDGVLFEAVFMAPPGRDGFLSPRTGIGAVQSLVKPLGIQVIVHDCHRSQTIVLRKAGKNVVARWQYISAPIGNVSAFSVRGFLALDAPAYYFLTTFEGPLAWVASRQMLSRTWKKLLEKGNNPNDTSERIPPGRERSEVGHLQLRLTEMSTKYLLQSAKQLGL